MEDPNTLRGHRLEPVEGGLAWEFVTQAGRTWAAWKVEQWGYPRPITDSDRRLARWYIWGPGIFWLQERGEVLHQRELIVHACLPPAFRRRVYPRPWLRLLVQLAQRIKYDVLRYLGDPESEVAGYLRRLGWVHDGESLVFTLGGRDAGAGEAEGALPPAGQVRSGRGPGT